MKKSNSAVILLFILTFMILSALLATGTYADDDKQGTISVVLDDNYPPYSFRDSNGNLQGITIDQWKLFEKKTGIRVELTGMEWNGAFQAMKEGKYDVVDTISYNKERDEFLDYTQPYATIDVPIFFHENISGIADADSLKGFTVAAKKGDNAINELRKHGIPNIKVYDSAEAVIKAARDQEIVIFVVGKPPAMYYMYKMGIQDKFKYTASLYTSKFYRAVKEGDKQMLDTLNVGFASISKKEYREIDEKWFGSTNQVLYETKLFKEIIIVTSIILIVVLFLLIWNRTLQIKVRQKTKELSLMVGELQTSEARVRALLEAIPDIFFLLDEKGRIVDYHAAKDTKLYTEPEHFLNRSLCEIFPGSLGNIFISAITRAIESRETQHVEYSLDVDGESSVYEARLVSYGKNRVVGIIRDITERKRSEEKLIAVSTHDALTGVYNRYFFENEVSRLQSGEFRSLYVGMFDLDGLKLINDTMGHSAGDKYLVQTVQIIIDSFPKESIISRIGGDEFCVILVDKTQEEVREYMNCFNEEIDRFNQSDNVIQVSISFGYVFSENRSLSIHEMIIEADNRMYRVKLHRRQSMKSEVVQTMKNMLEARDFITEGHASRMEELAVRLSTAIGIPDKDIADIRLLAQFHDIGKVGIPDHILFKPAKLTHEEYEIMKRHTEIGHRIAESSVDLLPIADFILKHHEYWDGTGYPFGIKGTEIPIECRILSIVDAYDAMTNDRPYRKAMPKEAALGELKRCAGTQFDPSLVEKFADLMNLKK